MHLKSIPELYLVPAYDSMPLEWLIRIPQAFTPV